MNTSGISLSLYLSRPKMSRFPDAMAYAAEPRSFENQLPIERMGTRTLLPLSPRMNTMSVTNTCHMKMNVETLTNLTKG